ncbi:MAG: rhodanese-like domain-containing protein [Verrucomicrobium sp.]
MNKWLILMFATLAMASSAFSAEPKDVDPAAAEKLIKEGKVTVLDVRTKDEFDEGHIKGAMNVDFKKADFEKQLAGLDKSKSYLVHCQAGGRSTASMKIFEKLGFQSIFHLNDGFMAWEEAGKPVQK